MASVDFLERHSFVTDTAAAAASYPRASSGGSPRSLESDRLVAPDVAGETSCSCSVGARRASLRHTGRGDPGRVGLACPTSPSQSRPTTLRRGRRSWGPKGWWSRVRWTQAERAWSVYSRGPDPATSLNSSPRDSGRRTD